MSASLILLTPRSALAGGVMALVLALFALLPGIRPHLINIGHVIGDTYEYRNASREARAETALGVPWKLMQLAREQTPTTARILIPADPRKGPLANRLWCAYYLYPRHVVSERDLTGPPQGQADYVLVCGGWGLALAGVPADSIKGDENGLMEIR